MGLVLCLVWVLGLVQKCVKICEEPGEIAGPASFWQSLLFSDTVFHQD